MTNRERLIARLTTQSIPSKLKVELDYYMSVDRDPPEEGELPYDMANAFLDAMDFAEDNQDKQLEHMCESILIELGYYIPMSQADINNTYVTRGKVWDFKLSGIPYKGQDSFGSWLEK